MQDWAKSISSISLERGCGYSESGYVHLDGKVPNGWCVTASGGNGYAVFVSASTVNTCLVHEGHLGELVSI